MLTDPLLFAIRRGFFRFYQLQVGKKVIRSHILRILILFLAMIFVNQLSASDRNPNPDELIEVEPCYGCPGVGEKCSNYPTGAASSHFVFDSNYAGGGYWEILACPST